MIYIAHRGALVSYATTIMGERGRAEDVVQEAYIRFRSAALLQQLDDPVAYQQVRRSGASQDWLR